MLSANTKVTSVYMALAVSLLLLATVLNSSSTLAETLSLPPSDLEESAPPVDRYHIEYVLFKQSDPDMAVLSYEHADVTFDDNKPKRVANPFTDKALTPAQITYTSPDIERLLVNTPSRLSAKDYDILSEFSWIQDINNDSQTVPLIIQPRALTSQLMDSPLLQSVQENPAAGSLLIRPTRAMPESYYGELTIKRSRYMHAELALNYYVNAQVGYRSLLDFLATPYWAAKPFISLVIPTPIQINESNLSGASSADLGLGSVVTKSFSFHSSRRIKNGEIHYFDHPYLGLIVTLTKVVEEAAL